MIKCLQHPGWALGLSRASIHSELIGWISYASLKNAYPFIGFFFRSGVSLIGSVSDLQASTASILKLAETILAMDTTSVNVQYMMCFLAA